ncbi:capsular biosynthesis protein [Rhizorhapis suberifaciens]|uniref:Capsular polysaccharide export protein n=1 Tax=Rhizorhapis suberifaciens TaxID=13656 RepID=A0A840HPW6_9SPHN|nr:capsular biosynthesis protein [Rhizorhapis suberifaciens]MBB4640092.1 capsular polysaccharide export protein [Rhizorhapis suberifaciens]
MNYGAEKFVRLEQGWPFRGLSRKFHFSPSAFPLRTRIILLQGPVGPFFRHLQEHLEESGFDAWRISFNAGDRFFAPRRKRIDFAGSLDEWESWFTALLTEGGFTRVILFGSSRPVHRVARRVAKAVGVEVLSLEEGYIRPGYVTVERDGNNADSPIAGKLPPKDFVAPPEAREEVTDYNSFRAMAWHAAVYYLVRELFSTRKQKRLSHRRVSILAEIAYWIRNGWRRVTGQGRNFAAIQRLLEHYHHRYFLVPLQVAADSQMGEAARGWNTPRLIAETLSSFARTAPAGYRLVYKIHPMERGRSNDRAFIMQTAEALGVADRVDVIDTGSIGLLTRHSAGMITINSTSGLSAIYHGAPLMVLGDAIYAHDALVVCAESHPQFDAFWTCNTVADAAVRRRYLGWIRAKCLVSGDFYELSGIKIALNFLSHFRAVENGRFRLR